MIRAIRGRRRRMTLRTRGASFRIDLRAVVVILALGLVSTAGIVANVGYGEYPIAPLDVVRTVFGVESGDGNYDFIVNTLRLPRALVALLVGVALGISGAILQGLTRNPLAAPDIIGINAGAGLAAVTCIVVLPSFPSALLPPVAFGGAFFVAVLLYLLAWRGSSSPLRLILIGIGLGAVATALTTTMIVFGEIFEVSKALVWLTGSVYGRTWEQVWPLLPWLVVFVPLSFAFSRNLNVLNLGEDVAKGLGVRVEVRAWRAPALQRGARRRGRRHRRNHRLRRAHSPAHRPPSGGAVARQSLADLGHDRRRFGGARGSGRAGFFRGDGDSLRNRYGGYWGAVLSVPALQESG